MGSENYIYEESEKFPGVFFFKKTKTHKERYSWLYQGKGINALAAINQAMVDEAVAGGQQGIVKDGVSVSFSPGLSAKELILDDRTAQVFFYIIQIYAKNLGDAHCLTVEDMMRSRYVGIKVSEVARLFNMTVRGARKMLEKAIDTLYNLSVEWEETEKHFVEGREINTVNKFRFRLLTRVNEFGIRFGQRGKLRTGYVRVALEPDFARYLPTANGVWFPTALYGISPSRQPGAFGIGLKMVLHYRMNYYKKNKDVIGVETLLSAATDIPNYNAIKSKGEISRRIMRPFIRALETLVEKGILVTWDFREPTTESVVPVDLVSAGIPYEDFRMLNVRFTLTEYPKLDFEKTGEIAADAD